MRIVCDHELWPVEKVVPYHANIKIHSEAQVTKLAAMIAEYGWDQPIAVDGDGVIIKGHARLEAAKKLGMTEVPVIVRADLSPAQAKASRIADNNSNESEWHTDNLKLELDELRALDFDTDLTGFLEPAPLDDDLPEPPPPGTAEPGSGGTYKIQIHFAADEYARFVAASEPLMRELEMLSISDLVLHCVEEVLACKK